MAGKGFQMASLRRQSDGRYAVTLRYCKRCGRYQAADSESDCRYCPAESYSDFASDTVGFLGILAAKCIDAEIDELSARVNDAAGCPNPERTPVVAATDGVD
jgi:hypothetical protein